MFFVNFKISLALICHPTMLKITLKGRGGALVVSVLNFYSDYPSSNPAEVYCFFL